MKKGKQREGSFIILVYLIIVYAEAVLTRAKMMFDNLTAKRGPQ